MTTKISDVAERIRTLRDILEISVEDMAVATAVTPEEYLNYEAGKMDFTLIFLFKCADKLGVDYTELLSGEDPKLTLYSVIRTGHGLPMNRRHGFTYNHLAPHFKDKITEPLLVTAPYYEEEQDKPIKLSYHEGQEFDYILKGSLKVQVEDHIEILNVGDSMYYNSKHGHGMIATGGEECVFLAIVIKE